MELKSDIICRGNTWYQVGQKYGYNENPIFFKTFWASFKLCIAIGILYDKQLDDEEDAAEDEKMTVPRTMFNRHSGEMQFFFQSAILSSKCVDLSEKDRLFLAFSEDISEEELEGEDYETLTKGVTDAAINFDKIGFLKKFANYGATRMLESLADNEVETMENLATFLVDSYKGDTDELAQIADVEELIEEI